MKRFDTFRSIRLYPLDIPPYLWYIYTMPKTPEFTSAEGNPDNLPLRDYVTDERAIATLQSRGLPPDLHDRLAYLTSRQREYLALRASGESVRDAAARLNISDERLKRWYSQGGAYLECCRAINVARSDAAVALARSITTMAAPVSAWRMAQAAEAEDATSRDSSHRQRARETVLETAGVIERQPLVQVAQQVILDPATIRAELAAIRAEREALAALLGAPALVAGKEATIDASSGTA